MEFKGSVLCQHEANLFSTSLYNMAIQLCLPLYPSFTRGMRHTLQLDRGWHGFQWGMREFILLDTWHSTTSNRMWKMNLLQLWSLLWGTILKRKLDAAHSFYKCLILYLRPTLHSKSCAYTRTMNMFTVKVWQISLKYVFWEITSLCDRCRLRSFSKTTKQNVTLITLNKINA